MFHRLHYFGKFTVPDDNYTACGEIIAIFQNEGFTLTEIYTNGEHSQHDCISEFHKEYASFSDFTRSVYDDFTHADTYFSEVDWNISAFHLQNNTVGISLRIGISERNKKDGAFITIVPPIYCGLSFETNGDEKVDDLAAYCNQLIAKTANWVTCKRHL